MTMNQIRHSTFLCIYNKNLPYGFSVSFSQHGNFYVNNGTNTFLYFFYRFTSDRSIYFFPLASVERHLSTRSLPSSLLACVEGKL